MFCAKCQSPLVGGSHICPSCGHDNALGLPPDKSPPNSHANRPHGHPHHLQLGTVAPLSTRTNWAARIGVLVVVILILAAAAVAWLRVQDAKLAQRVVWDSPPRAASGLPAGGQDFTCTLTEAGSVMCWGSNATGQLGDTAAVRLGDPATVRTDDRFVALDAGDAHVCAVRTDGQVLCWGANSGGQLGAATTAQCTTARGRVPCTVWPLETPAAAEVAVAAGAEHSCSIGRDSSVTCWGSAYRGQIGPTRTVGRNLLVHHDPRLHLATLSAGAYHNCGLTAGGTAMCWGWNGFGQLGVRVRSNTCGPTPATQTPCVPTPAPAAAGRLFRTIAAGTDHTCAVDLDGQAWCWGANRVGQLGNGQTDDSTSVAVAVSGDTRFQAIGAGQSFTCALATDGSVWCWGDGADGQLGAAGTTTSAVPVRVPLGEAAASLGVAVHHTCVVSVTARVYCWGAGGEGQLGGTRVAEYPQLREAGLPGNRR